MHLLSKLLLYFLLSLALIACSNESDEEKAEDEFQESSKTLVNTGLVTATAYSAEDRTICAGILQDGVVTPTAITVLDDDDVIAFSGQQEFALIEDVPTNNREDCLYLERGYAETKAAPIEMSAIIYKVKTFSSEEK